MSFLFINKTLRFNNIKTRTAMTAKISVFAICVDVIIYLLLYHLHDGTYKQKCPKTRSWYNWSQVFTNIHQKCLWRSIFHSANISYDTRWEAASTNGQLRSRIWYIYKVYLPFKGSARNRAINMAREHFIYHSQK